MPPFLGRNNLIPAGIMLGYFGLVVLTDVFFPRTIWVAPVLSVTAVVPMCIVGYRANRRWKQLLAESDGYLCPWCGYNLRETKDAELCPECGKDPRTWRGW